LRSGIKQVLKVLKPDSQLRSKMSAGKLSQTIDAAYENKRLAKSLVNRLYENDDNE